MANPWDPQNLKPNLRTLAQIVKGDKIRILPSGLIDRHHWFPDLGRKDKDSMTEVSKPPNVNGEGDEKLDGISRLFKTAIELSTAGGQWTNEPRQLTEFQKLMHPELARDPLPRPTVFISQLEITSALTGLENLLGSYEKENKAAQRQALEKIIKAVKEWLPTREFPKGYSLEAYRKAVSEFESEYEIQRKLTLKQKDYTLYQEGGICKAMCLDWVRRRLVKNKDSYGKSKKFFPGKLEDRVRSKAEKYLHDLQHTAVQSDNSLQELDKTRTGFANLDQGYSSEGHWPIKDVSPTAYTFDGKGKLFQKVLEKAVEAAEKKIQEGKQVCFYLSLRPDLSVNKSSHAVVFDFRSPDTAPRLYFFDPNYGEFEFGVAAEKDQELVCGFFGDLWALYAMQAQIYVTWRLTLYSLK